MSKSDPKKLELSIEEQKTYNILLLSIDEGNAVDRASRIARLRDFIIALQIKNGWLIPEGYEESL